MTEILDNNNTTGPGGDEMTVLKVYELAADAGRECQQLIEQFGEESASNVTLKIISILEHLELLVNEKTELEKQVSRLNEKLLVCQNELSRRTEENAHLQADLQKMEQRNLEDLEQWKEFLNKARRENKELKKQVNEKEGQVKQDKVMEQETFKVLLKLKETVDNQRDTIRAQDNELRSRNQDVEALQQQVDRLAKVNSNLRRKQELVESHSRNLIRQKSTLQVDVMRLNKNLIEQKTMADTDDIDGTMKDTPQVDNKDGENKVCFDPRDPDRPRFTLNELKKVLIERDEMHLKVVALEEELESYKSEEDQTGSMANTPSSCHQEENSGKNKPSGIRKFFANLFRGKDKTDVEEELKKWEILDLEEDDLIASSQDPLSQSVQLESSITPGDSQAERPRRHSDITPSRNNNNNDATSGKKNDSWFFGSKSRSSSTTREMLVMTSPWKPKASSSPRSSSPSDLPLPRETPPPVKPSRDDDHDEDLTNSYSIDADLIPMQAMMFNI
ncbi:RILP-like protein 1 [Lytechinus variegatus]|uniref:RILP-like protein 1 n=1 Tax=Lytechinus variegatus TaxID=7654 RepID=UPI001BB20551|nr:RILP-like protein 1 [Lytechinus variegatus]